MGSTPKAPKKTARQAAVERRQARELDEETALQEQRLKLQAGKGTTGVESLLAKPPEAGALPENVAPETKTFQFPKTKLGALVGKIMEKQHSGAYAGRFTSSKATRKHLLNKWDWRR